MHPITILTILYLASSRGEEVQSSGNIPIGPTGNIDTHTTLVIPYHSSYSITQDIDIVISYNATHNLTLTHKCRITDPNEYLPGIVPLDTIEKESTVVKVYLEGRWDINDTTKVLTPKIVEFNESEESNSNELTPLQIPLMSPNHDMTRFMNDGPKVTLSTHTYGTLKPPERGTKRFSEKEPVALPEFIPSRSRYQNKVASLIENQVLMEHYLTKRDLTQIYSNTNHLHPKKLRLILKRQKELYSERIKKLEQAWEQSITMVIGTILSVNRNRGNNHHCYHLGSVRHALLCYVKTYGKNTTDSTYQIATLYLAELLDKESKLLLETELYDKIQDQLNMIPVV